MPQGAPSCPAEATLDLLSGRWKLMIIYWLSPGQRRFNELQRNLGGITHRTLARTLREMADDGLVDRFDHQTIPPRVDYRLTAKGQALLPIITAMQVWAETYAGNRT